MASQTTPISQTSHRPPEVHFNQYYFNNIGTKNYKHIEISPEADNDTTQLVRAANNDNYFQGLTVGLFYKPEEHMFIGENKIDPMLNLLPNTCFGYTKCKEAGEIPEGKFMLIA